jgi:putative RNA 2'-phosphotransferase
MTIKELVKASKFLSLVLRHKPEQIGLTLDVEGWAEVNSLLKKMDSHGVKLTKEELKNIVENNDKKRFSFNEIGTKIRAAQGHSIEVDLKYEIKVPPQKLYHGTAKKVLGSIFKTGIEKRNRHHVHLSDNIDTAIKVGSRHGEPVVLIVDSELMHKDGFVFLLSDNNVWLTEHVPSKYFTVMNDETKDNDIQKN